MKFGKLRLSAYGTNNGRGFDILYDFGENFDFVEGLSKKEFSFIQPWMQFPNDKYSEACKLVSIELVSRFNDYEVVKEKCDSLEKYNTSLHLQIQTLRKQAAVKDACAYYGCKWPEEFKGEFWFRGEHVTAEAFNRQVQELKDLR